MFWIQETRDGVLVSCVVGHEITSDQGLVSATRIICSFAQFAPHGTIPYRSREALIISTLLFADRRL